MPKGLMSLPSKTLFEKVAAESIEVKNGFAHLPTKPGLGIDLDWDFIDNSTFKKF